MENLFLEEDTNKMKFEDLKQLKKLTGAISCRKRYHNKNKTGGNFGIDIYMKNGYQEIGGTYNTEGEIIEIHWGMDYKILRWNMKIRSVEGLAEIIRGIDEKKQND